MRSYLEKNSHLGIYYYVYIVYIFPLSGKTPRVESLEFPLKKKKGMLIPWQTHVKTLS
jgi:hypothetical protein